MATHKALSIRPEYIGEIAVGAKPIEYRTWGTAHRGDIVLCCTATRVSYGFAALVAEITACTKNGDMYEWALSNVRPIRPFFVTGKQRLFEIDAELEFLEPTDEAIEAAYADFKFEKEVAKK